MGTLDSLGPPDSNHNGDELSPNLEQVSINTTKAYRRNRLAELMTNCFHGRSPEKTRKFGDLVEHDVVRVHEETVAKRLRQNYRRELGRRIDTLLDFSVTPSPRKPERSDIDDHAIGRSEKAKVEYALQKAKEYDSLREEITRYERALGFEFACTSKANDLEVQANHIMQELKKMDVEWFYKPAKPKIGYHGQEHTRFYGDHFLSNLDIIERTQLFALCRAMPKGAHLHIHFNANLLPNFLLDIAKDMEHMFIWSNIPLEDVSALNRCRIQFSIMSQDTAKSRGEGNLFEKTYKSQQVMRYKDFRSQFLQHYWDHVDVDTWLQTKLVFQEEEAHNMLQTAEGAWEKFNARTQMMKGLFNYETAYRKYTRQCLEEFKDDNIQYAEIRPNFMSTNQVWRDDGSSKMDNEGIMDLIIAEYKAFQDTHQRIVVKGLKIIYCTPRSFNNDQVALALKECLDFKLDKRFSGYIAGFDLVGEEAKGKPLKAFRAEFLEFKRLCAEAKVEIPFLFHCGETLDIGTETDGNLVDAVLLGSKRIGHGFALPRHPYIMEQMKKRNVCIEVCPISNEILGLTPRISGHSMYSLLANDVPCTISTDNGTLFRSRLSHDFYQVMAGKSDMTLHGLRQLIEWSIEHSCMEPDLKQEVRLDWEGKWQQFCQRIVNGDFSFSKPGGIDQKGSRL